MDVSGGGGGESVTAISRVKAQMCLHLDVHGGPLTKNMDHCFDMPWENRNLF